MAIMPQEGYSFEASQSQTKLPPEEIPEPVPVDQIPPIRLYYILKHEVEDMDLLSDALTDAQMLRADLPLASAQVLQDLIEDCEQERYQPFVWPSERTGQQ